MDEKYNVSPDSFVDKTTATTTVPPTSSGFVESTSPRPPITEFNSDGTQNESQSSEQTVINADTSALKQKGYLHEDGPYSDQELKNSAKAFNNAVGTAFGLMSLATSLRTLTSSQPRNTQTNYYLKPNEKTLLRRKALEFAEPGITPYDVIEDFLYVLVAIDNYEDLQHISIVTGVEGLDNRSIIRDPVAILNTKDLYKIGYMANGLASLTMQFSTSFPQARSSADSTASAFSSIMSVAAFASSPIGSMVLAHGVGAVTSALGLSGSAAQQATTALTSAGSIDSFPGVSTVNDLVKTLYKTLDEAKEITYSTTNPANNFVDINGYGGIGGKIGQIPNVITKLETAQQQAVSASEMITKQNISTLAPVSADLFKISKKIKDTINMCSTIKDVNVSNSYPEQKVGDLHKTCSKINIMVGVIKDEVNGILTTISGINGPGNISSASTMLNRVGGSTTSSLMTKLTLGQAIPPSMLSNNPVMQPPSYAGKAFFGEGIVPMIAVDQMFNRRIAAYPNSHAGAGLQSFQMQNFASFGSSMSISSLLTRMTYGVSSVPSGSRLASVIDSKASAVAGLLGVNVLTSMIEPRRSDNAIPMMIALSSVLANDTSCPFPTSVFSNGWKQASSVGNDIQKYAPAFLLAARTSL